MGDVSVVVRYTAPTEPSTSDKISKAHPQTFPSFPFTPYTIQLGLMRAIYHCLETGGVGMMESPTGTGKTMSIICSSLQWLQDHRQRLKEEKKCSADHSKACAVITERACRPSDSVIGGQQLANDHNDDDDDLPDWLLEAAASASIVAASERNEAKSGLKVRDTSVGAHQMSRSEEARRRLKIGSTDAFVRNALTSYRQRPSVVAGIGGGANPSARTKESQQLIMMKKCGNDSSSPTAPSPSHDYNPELDDQYALEDNVQPDDSHVSRNVGARRRRSARDRVSECDDESGSSSEDGHFNNGGKTRGGTCDINAGPTKTQIIFCSRTHSQLSQFIGELKRTSWPDQFSVLALAARKVLCINEAVKVAGPLGLINERCTDLIESKQRNKKALRSSTTFRVERQQPSSSLLGTQDNAIHPAVKSNSSVRQQGLLNSVKKRSGGCQYLVDKGDAWEGFVDSVLGQPLDVEDLAKAGADAGVCPYFGSRRLVQEADVLLMPYSAILSEDTRNTLGVRLEGNIVIFDEAHNLVEAVNASHSCNVSSEHLSGAVRQLTCYLEWFSSRLSPHNAQQVQLLLRLISSLLRAAATYDYSSSSGSSHVITVNDFLFDCHLDSINLHHLMRWVKDSKLLHKVSGFAQSQELSRMNDPLNTTATGSSSSTHCVAGAPEIGASFVGIVGMQSRGTRTTSSCHNNECRKLGKCTTTFKCSRLGKAAQLSALHACTTFMIALMNPDSDGRIIIQQQVAVASSSTTTTTSSGPSFDGNLVSNSSTAVGSSTMSSNTAGGRGSSTSSSCSRELIQQNFLTAGTASTTFLASSAQAASRINVQLSHTFTLKYVQLNSSAHFSKLLHSAKAVVLASGTLSPVQGLIQQLFPCLPSTSPVLHYECGHVVPRESLLALVAGKGPSGMPLCLKHAERSKPEVMDELGRLLLNVCGAVPGGVVAFFPSFFQLELVAARWRSTGIHSSLENRKKIFVEPRSASEVDAVLQEYADSIRASSNNTGQEKAAQEGLAARKKGGALLLSVVGAKLSEGINFGDELGRCVVVVGMPYPNPEDPELKERMHFLDQQSTSTSSSQDFPPSIKSGVNQKAEPLRQIRFSGGQYYEDLCMKAINQCVGRVIRHKDDYAAVVLVDSRYLQAGSRHKTGFNATSPIGQHVISPLSKRPVDCLPGWMKTSLIDSPLEFGHIMGHLHKFFREKSLNYE